MALRTLNTPSDNETQDQLQRQHAVPITRVAEVWPVAHLHAYRDLLPVLEQLHKSLAPGTGPNPLPDELRGRVAAAIAQINELGQQRWNEFIGVAAVHPLHAETLRNAGQPAQIQFNGTYPFLRWLSPMDGPEANWHPISLRIAEDASGEVFDFNPPFRPVWVEHLPETTIKVPVTDPIHAASIALAEVIGVALGDLSAARGRVSARDNWVRIRMMAHLLQSVVEERMRAELSVDDFKDWVIPSHSSIPLSNAPMLIASHTCNAAAIQILAMRVVQNFILDAMDRAEREPGNETTGQTVDQVFDELEKYHQRIRTRVDALNELVLSECKNLPADYSYQVVARPIPRGTPFFAVFPNLPDPLPSNVVPLVR